MRILARQNCINVGTQIILAKDQLGIGETCSGDAASGGFGGFMQILERQTSVPILKRYWQKE